MAVIGYMDGTDPMLLSKLVAMGHETIPIGNGLDNHGKYLRLLTSADGIDILVGCLHKFVPTKKHGLTSVDIMLNCHTHRINTIVLAPREFIDKARSALGNVVDFVTVITPEAALDKILEFC